MADKHKLKLKEEDDMSEKYRLLHIVIEDTEVAIPKHTIVDFKFYASGEEEYCVEIIRTEGIDNNHIYFDNYERAKDRFNAITNEYEERYCL